MSALDLLDDAIEKAGVKRMPASTRLGLRFAERRGMTTSAKRYFKVDTNADYDTSKKPTREKVRVKGLTATQNTLHAGFRAQKNPSNKPISVYRSGGKTVIMEGHHRSARAAARGQTHIDALVYRKPRIKKALEALDEAIAKAGLIKPGKPSLLRRVGFLLSTGSNERNYKIGRYLEGRKAGKGFGPKGKRRARTGTYTGVYATGVNKSEAHMSALDELDEAIEKAGGLMPRGGSKRMLARVSEGRGGRKTSQQTMARFLARRAGSKLSRSGDNYLRVKKSNEPTALDQLDEAIEKAKPLMVRLSPAQRRNAVMSRLQTANSAKGLSRTRGGTGRSKLPSGTGKKFVPADGMNGRAAQRRYEGKKQGKASLAINLRAINESRAKRGLPPRKRTLLGRLK